MLYKGSQLAVRDSKIERQIAITRGDQLFSICNIKPWCSLEKLQECQELISGHCMTLMVFLWCLVVRKEYHYHNGLGWCVSFCQDMK